MERRGSCQNQAALGHILTEVVQEKKSCGPVVFIFQFHTCPVERRMCHRQRNTCFHLTHFLSWRRSKLPDARLWSPTLCPCDSTCPTDHRGNWLRDSRAKSFQSCHGALGCSLEIKILPENTTEKYKQLYRVKVTNTLGVAQDWAGKVPLVMYDSIISVALCTQNLGAVSSNCAAYGKKNWQDKSAGAPWWIHYSLAAAL